MLKAENRIYFLILAFSALRLGVAPFFGLGVDEAHYVLYAKYLDWSYLDHPPLVGWLHAPIFYLLGASEFLSRLPAVLIFACASWLCYLFMLRISQSISLALWSVLALNCSFMQNALGLMLLPDTPLLLLIFLLIFTAARLARDKRPLDFLWMGLILGLMGLAKYTSILLVPPLAVFFLMKKRYDVIFSPWMLLAAIIALLFVAPVFFWNFTHDFSSFKYQGGHVFGLLASSGKNFIESLGAQFGAYSPFLFVFAVYGFFKVLQNKDDYLRLAVLFGATIIIFFMATSFYERTLPHWPAIFYLLFIPIGAWQLLVSPKKKLKTFFNISIGVSLAALLLACAVLVGKFIPFPDYKSPFRDIYGYPEMAQRADEIIKQAPSPAPKALAVTNWTMGSRVMYYNLPYGHEVFVLDSRQDQFDVWQKKSPEGKDLLFLNTHFENVDVAGSLRCDEVSIAGKMDLTIKGAKVNSVEYIWCKNYRGVKN